MKVLIHRSMSERMGLVVHIRKLEIESNRCDREWRENKSNILQKTYSCGRVALEQETGLQGVIASFQQKLVNRV